VSYLAFLFLDHVIHVNVEVLGDGRCLLLGRTRCLKGVGWCNLLSLESLAIWVAFIAFGKALAPITVELSVVGHTAVQGISLIAASASSKLLLPICGLLGDLALDLAVFTLAEGFPLLDLI
jgi:hypothetical protein